MGYLCNMDDFVHILGDFEVIFWKNIQCYIQKCFMGMTK